MKKSLGFYLFGVPRRFNTLADTNFSFKLVQNMRLLEITLMVILLFMCAFVLGKLILVYFICWAIFFMLLALVMLSCASGRQVVERKLLGKLKEQELLNH